MNHTKLKEAFAKILYVNKLYHFAKDYPDNAIIGNHFDGGFNVEDERFKRIKNGDSDISGILRLNAHSEGLGLGKSHVGRCSDLTHPETIKELERQGRTLNSLTGKDFGNKPDGFHCEHIAPVKKLNELFKSYIKSGGLTPSDMADWILQRTAVVVIPWSYKSQIDDSKDDFDRYPIKPEFNGTPITSMEQLTKLREQTNNQIYQMLQSMKDPNIDWEKEISQMLKQPKVEEGSYAKLPDMKDPNIKPLLEAGSNKDIMIYCYPKHFKQRHLKKKYKAQYQQVEKDWGIEMKVEN
jgi:hypothetical protein